MICRNHVDVSEGIRRCARCGSTFCADCLVDIGGVPYCAVCKTEQLLDARSGVERTKLDIAGIGRRIVGYLIDTFVLYFVNFAIGLVIGVVMAASGNSTAAGLVGALTGIPVTVVYDALLTAARGQTLGKMAMTMKVVSE